MAQVTGVEFRLLGPLQVLVSERELVLEGRRQQIVLAMLLLDSGRVVPTERLVEAVWDAAPPVSARNQIQIAVSRLRSTLRSAAPSLELIASHSAGYRIDPRNVAVDLMRFDQLVALGRAVAQRGDIGSAVKNLRDGLGLWRGPAVAGLASHVLEAVAMGLNERRLAVHEECIDLELQLGKHAGLISELQQLVGEHPLRENFRAQLVVALYRSGRHAEALATIREFRQLLIEEHGIDPSDRIQELELAILSNDPSLDLPTRHASIGPGSMARMPRQLPPALTDFVGRDTEARHVNRLLAGSDGRDPEHGLPLVVVNGPAGIGKTAFATYICQSVQSRFPDGQLFARLRGIDSEPLSPAHVLGEFLRTLGASPGSMPATVDEMSAEFRTMVADARLLILLDDAVDAGQISPLLPASSGCAVVITSRRPLHELPGGQRVELGALDPESSLALISGVIGDDRVARERTQAERLAELCAGLPLALRIVAAKVSVRKYSTLERMCQRLEDEHHRLDELALPGEDLRASLAVSYRLLSERAQRLLLLLGVLGAADFADWVAAPLLDKDARHAADILQELTEVSLVGAVAVDERVHPRYRLHDLVRLYARERLSHDIAADERDEAHVRLLRCWLGYVRRAHARLSGGVTVLRSNAEPWEPPDAPADEHIGDPIGWFVTEHMNLAAAVEAAANLGQVDLCWELAMTSVALFEVRGYSESWRATHATALRACRQSGNRRGEAAMIYSSGMLAFVESRLADAESAYRRSIELFGEIGERHGRGLARRSYASILRMRADFAEARAEYAAALADLRVAGDRGAQADALSGLAQTHVELGEYDDAERLLLEAIRLCDDVGDLRGQAQVRHGLGHLYLTLDRIDEAHEQLLQAEKIVLDLGDIAGSAYAKLGLALVDMARGESHTAGRLLEQADEIARSIGNRLCVGRVSLAQAELAIYNGNWAAFDSALHQARNLFGASGATSWLKRVDALEERAAAQRSESGSKGD